jgi:hypothetical protein
MCVFARPCACKSPPSLNRLHRYTLAGAYRDGVPAILLHGVWQNWKPPQVSVFWTHAATIAIIIGLGGYVHIRCKHGFYVGGVMESILLPIHTCFLLHCSSWLCFAGRHTCLACLFAVYVRPRYVGEVALLTCVRSYLSNSPSQQGNYASEW